MPPPAIETPPDAPVRVIVFEWWQILLMVLGGVFIICVIIFFWRRRARKQRAKETAAFAQKKMEKKGFRQTLSALFGGKKRRSDDLESSKPSRRSGGGWSSYSFHHDGAPVHHSDAYRDAASIHSGSDRSRNRLMVEQYATSRRSSVTTSQFELEPRRRQSNPFTIGSDGGPSMYSQATGKTHSTAQPRLPVKNHLTSRFSVTTSGSNPPKPRPQPPPMPDLGLLSPKSNAEAYKLQHIPKPESYWDVPEAGAVPDRNPFRANH
jgi:cbb3-type cytochrome oxidase subunit 3